MILKNQITTIQGLVEFIGMVAEILEMEMMFNPSGRTLTAAENFRSGLERVMIALDTEKTGKRRLIELGLPPETILNAEAKKLVDEAQAEILKYEFMSFEMDSMGPMGELGMFIAVMEAMNNPNAKHEHKCSGCGNTWQHANSCGGSESAHTCSNCGHVEWARH